jgi:hypothetical protein
MVRNIMLFLGLALCFFAGCCDGDVLVSGNVRDAVTNAPLDSVHINLFYIEKKEVHTLDFAFTDSLGGFFISDFGYCGKTDFFALVSKPGYFSQGLSVEALGPELEIKLQRD